MSELTSSSYPVEGQADDGMSLERSAFFSADKNGVLSTDRAVTEAKRIGSELTSLRAATNSCWYNLLVRRHDERHRGSRGAWLRAAVLGADDGIVSTSSLMIGVAATSSSTASSTVLVAGIAGMVGGALSMAAGEYVSVSSQRDAEEADIAREKQELSSDPKGELDELEAIYRRRGLDAALARQVAEQLSAAGDRLTTHMRDELGMDPSQLARPFQAALVSAASFAGLALLPVLALLLAPPSLRIGAMALVSLLSLGSLGALGGHLGGAPMGRASLRVMLGGGVAMAITALIGYLLGVAGLG